MEEVKGSNPLCSTTIMTSMDSLFETQLERARHLVVRPDWYMDFGRVKQMHVLGVGGVQAALGSGGILQAAERGWRNLVDVFEALLAEDAVRIGRPGEEPLVDQDEDRVTPDTVVIHHSSRAEGITTPNLNALELLRLYVPEYAKGTVKNPDGSLQPIYSGHFDETGRQVFYPYHWIVRQDGEAERLLDDSAFAWHSGDYDVNARSVAICIDDNLTQATPTDAALEGTAEVIRTHYPAIAERQGAVIGHREALSSSTCPGDLFLTAWKAALLERISV
jgi:hypothetical protein